MKVILAEYQLVRFEEVELPDDSPTSLAEVVGQSGLRFDAERQVVVSIEQAQADASVRGLRERAVSPGEHFVIIASPAGLSRNHSATEARAGTA